MISYRLVQPEGRPVIVSSTGERLPLCTASDPILDIPALSHSTPELWLERARMFADSGVRLWSLDPTRLPGTRDTAFWTADGLYPPGPDGPDHHDLTWQAARILELAPDARFFVRLFDRTPAAWLAAHPDELQLNCTGEQRQWGSPQISLASTVGLAAMTRFLTHVITWCESQTWRDRIFGYFFLPQGEGITNLVVSGRVFDVSPAMQHVFTAYLRRHYTDDAALRAAWGDETVTLATAAGPRDADWRAALAGVEHWPAPGALRRFRDYFALQRELTLHWYQTLIRATVPARAARPTVFGMDIAKQHLLGWQHNLFFNGAGGAGDAHEMFLASGSIDLGELLDEPGLDMLLTPADYTARSVGYGWEPEGIADSLRVRGKAILIENDARTFSTTGGEHRSAGAFRNVAEVRAGFLRNCAWHLTRGGYDEWGTGGGSYYDHPLIQQHGVQPCVRLMEATPYWPHRETEHAIAMIVDDTSPAEEDGTAGYQNLACIWQRAQGLAHCGIPYRIYLFSDLSRETMPDYRAYYFPNLFRIDDQRLAILRRKVFRDGRLSIFGPATGITDGRRLGAEGAGRVLGVEMELVPKRASRRVIVGGDHPIVGALPAALTYGDSLPYGPVLVPADAALDAADATELGLATLVWAFNRPGLFIKDHGTHKIAWTAALPMPAALLRELARWSGCHVWCEEDDVVLASDTVAALHSVKPGRRILNLPAPGPVWDLLSGSLLGDAVERIEWTVAPPETRLYYRGAENPFPKCTKDCDG